MSRLTLKFVLGAAVILFASASCRGPSEDPTNPADPDGTPETGEARDAICISTVIGNVVVQPGTFHWEDPGHLLTSAEGCGPQSLSVGVAASVSPTISISSNYTPTDSQISFALGYSVTDTIVLTASSTMLVPTAAYGWLEAYPTFQKSTWDIVGYNCSGSGPTPIPQMLLGTGVAYRPVGVYFKATRALDCPVGGLIGPGPFPIVVPSGAGGGPGGPGAGGAGGVGGGGPPAGSGGAGGSGGSGGSGGTNKSPFPIVVPTGAGGAAASSSSATGANPFPIVVPVSTSGAGGTGGTGGTGG